MSESFRLFHISDLHLAASTYYTERGRSFLRSYGLKETAERHFRPAQLALLKAVARAAYLSSPLDAILITGDLANWGDVESLQAALRFVAADPADTWHDTEGLPTLRGRDVPLYLLPGNHDRYSQGVGGWGGAGGTHFDEVFKDYWNVGQGVNGFVLKQSLGIVIGDLTLASSFHGTTFLGGLWGQGKAYIERVAFMRVMTQLLREQYSNIPIIWAVHFAPGFEGLPRDLQLIDDGRLIQAAQDMDIRYILCGHTHEPRDYPVGAGNSVKVLCVGSASQRNAHRNTLNLLEIKTEDGTIAGFDSQVLMYEPAEGFVPAAP